jgi:hypothetical protein
MGPSEKTQHAIRRSTRLPLEVPVLVTSLNAAVTFSEQCNTTLVNAHGCGLIVPRVLAQGIQVRLEIVSAKRHTTARVAEVVPLGGDPETCRRAAAVRSRAERGGEAGSIATLALDRHQRGRLLPGDGCAISR